MLVEETGEKRSASIQTSEFDGSAVISHYENGLKV
jgi:hypothetical protein